MGSWHLVLIIMWSVVLWYSAAALIRPTQAEASEWLPYSGEILGLVSIFLSVYSLQQMIEHYHAWKLPS